MMYHTKPHNKARNRTGKYTLRHLAVMFLHSIYSLKLCTFIAFMFVWPRTNVLHEHFHI